MRGIIWLRNKERILAEVEKLVKDYGKVGYSLREKRWIIDDHAQLYFSNGDYWDITTTQNISRQRYNVAYIDHNISEEFIQTIIKPQIILRPFQAYKYI